MGNIDPQKTSTSLHTRTIENKNNILLSNTSTSLTDSEIDAILNTFTEVVEPDWRERHAKLIRQQGADRYVQLAEKAKKYGRNPKALMATFVNKEVLREEA